MTFVDTNVFAARGRKSVSTAAASRCHASDEPGLVTSAEVLQEILHVFLRRGRLDLCDQAFALVYRVAADLWAVEPEDIAPSTTTSPGEAEAQTLLERLTSLSGEWFADPNKPYATPASPARCRSRLRLESMSG